MGVHRDDCQTTNAATAPVARPTGSARSAAEPSACRRSKPTALKASSVALLAAALSSECLTDEHNRKQRNGGCQSRERVRLVADGVSDGVLLAVALGNVCDPLDPASAEQRPLESGQR